MPGRAAPRNHLERLAYKSPTGSSFRIRTLGTDSRVSERVWGV